MKLFINNKIINIKKAETFFEKLIGLLNKKEIEENFALLIKNCQQVHCFFMRFPIDVLFLDRDFKVIYYQTISPFSISKYIKKAYYVLEIHKDFCKINNIKIGDRLDIR